MDRTNKRLILGAGCIFSLAALIHAARPRAIAFNTASTANTIALQRAGSCIPLTFVQANRIPLDKGRTLEPGTLVCDRNGRTGQINGSHAIDFLRQGDANQINQILKQRGL